MTVLREVLFFNQNQESSAILPDMLTEEDQRFRDAKAKLREYAILETRILILLHNKGGQSTEDLFVLLALQDTPENQRSVRLALGSLFNKELIRPSTCVVPGISIVDELRPITGGFDHDSAIRKLELPEPTVVPRNFPTNELQGLTTQAAQEVYRLFNDFIRTEGKLKGIPETAMSAWNLLGDSLGLRK
jgi:hypothetical protein